MNFSKTHCFYCKNFYDTFPYNPFFKVCHKHHPKIEINHNGNYKIYKLSFYFEDKKYIIFDFHYKTIEINDHLVDYWFEPNFDDSENLISKLKTMITFQ
jgi:hypothetical protein